jgi:quinol monooxygenase YgiN
MGFQKITLLLLLLIISVGTFGQKSDFDFNKEEMMVRIAAIEIDSSYIEEYIAILKEESEASIRLEPGVICLFPMFQKEDPTQIRLLEIYTDQAAYEAHLQTPHFKHYKETTLKMIKDLKLIDMETIGPESMATIFNKLKQ